MWWTCSTGPIDKVRVHLKVRAWIDASLRDAHPAPRDAREQNLSLRTFFATQSQLLGCA
jgi:hypothetical protein